MMFKVRIRVNMQEMKLMSSETLRELGFEFSFSYNDSVPLILSLKISDLQNKSTKKV